MTIEVVVCAPCLDEVMEPNDFGDVGAAERSEPDDGMEENDDAAIGLDLPAYQGLIDDAMRRCTADPLFGACFGVSVSTL